ncbi:MAG: hypothetical protein WAX66_01560, partial [Patescibacteria group bacterium]
MKIPETEERIVYYYWFVLCKMWKEIELRGKNEDTISYTVILHPALNDPYKPNSTEEQIIVRKFIDAGVAEMVGDKPM